MNKTSNFLSSQSHRLLGITIDYEAMKWKDLNER